MAAPCRLRKMPPGVGLDHQLRPHFVEVLLDPGERPLADGDDAVLLALAQTHEERPALRVEVVDGEVHELAAPDARGVEGLEKVAKACYERGLVTITAGTFGNVIRTLMPLVIRDEELEEGLDVLEAALAAPAAPAS